MEEMSEYIKASHLKYTTNEEDMDTVELRLLEETINNPSESSVTITPVEPNHTELEEALKKFRMKLATEKNMKAFHIFNNKTLDDLLLKQPRSLDELKTVTGLGEMKINSFGAGIIEIIQDHQ